MDDGPTQVLPPTSPPPASEAAESPPHTAAEGGDHGLAAPPTGSLVVVVPDFLSTSGLLDTRASSEEGGEDGGHEGLRVVYLAQGWLDAKNVHHALISDRSELYTWGSGAFGRLGHGDTYCEARPRAVEVLAKQRIRWVACGWDTTAAVTERGELYLWGSGEPTPRIVSFPGEGTLRVAKVCLGEAHAAVLSERGDVYTFGAFAHGRKTKRVTQRRQRGQKGWARGPQPRIVYNLPTGQTRNIACGSHHILALTADGKVYSWGDGSWGKLGHASETEEWLPRPIEALAGQTIVQIDAGDDHSLFLSTDGTVWTCGCPHDGRLGLSEEAIKEHQEEFGAAKRDDAAILVPSAVGGPLSSRQVVAICAGAAFTLCRTLAKEVFYFGKPDFDETLDVAHSPSLLAIESYPLLAMASRAYRSMTVILPEDVEGSEGKEVKKMEFTRIVVNDDKKAASFIQKQKESPQVRHLRSTPRRGSFPEIGQIAKVKGIWDKRGKTLGEHDVEALRQAVAHNRKSGAGPRNKSHIVRCISDTQLGDEEMVGHNSPTDQNASPVARADASPREPEPSKLSLRPEGSVTPDTVSGVQPLAAPEEGAVGPAGDKTAGSSAQPPSEEAIGGADEAKAARAEEAESEADPKGDPALGDSLGGKDHPATVLPVGVEVVKPLKDLQPATLEEPDEADQGHSDGDDDEDIRGETPRQRAANATAHAEPPGQGSKGEDTSNEGEDSATEGEDEEDIRLESPRVAVQQQASSSSTTTTKRDAEAEEEHGLTEGEDEEDIRGEELTPRAGEVDGKVRLDAPVSKGENSDDDDVDEPTDGEDEEDIRGETPRGKENGDQLTKVSALSSSSLSRLSDDEDDTLTEGDDEQDIRGEDDEPLWVDVHLAAVAQMEKSTNPHHHHKDEDEEEERKTRKQQQKKQQKKKEKRAQKQQQQPQKEQQEKPKREEGNSARRIVRNISLKLIGKSATIERDASPNKKTTPKVPSKKSHTLTASSPRVSRERLGDANEQRTAAKASSGGSSSGSSVSCDPAASAEGDEPGQWMAATASPVRRRSRGFLMCSGRTVEADGDYDADDGSSAAAPASGGGSSNKELRKSREKLAIRRSASCDPPQGGDETGAGGLKVVQIQHSQEVEARRKSREVAVQDGKRASREVDSSGLAGAPRERRASNGFAEKAIERRSKELHMDELEKAAADEAAPEDPAESTDKQASSSSSPFKKFHTIGRAHRRRNKTLNSGAVSDSMDAVPTKQKRFSISTPFLNFSSPTNRARANFTKEAAQLAEFEKRLKNVKPGATEERAAVLKEWADFLLAQHASKQQSDKAGAKDSPAASPLPSPKKSRFGTLRRRKKDEDKEAEKPSGSPEESGDEDIAGTIIGNEEIVLRLQSGEMIKLAYKETKRGWVEDRSSASPPEVSVSPPPSPSPPASPSGSPRTPGRSRLPRVPLFRTHSLSLNFLRGGSGSEKKSDRIERANGGDAAETGDGGGGGKGSLSRQKSDARIGASAVDRLTRVDEEAFSEVWRREKERHLAEAEAEEQRKRKAERRQRKKQKEKEWALKGEEAEESKRSSERPSVHPEDDQHSRHSESDYSSSDLKLEPAPAATLHSAEPCEQEV